MAVDYLTGCWNSTDQCLSANNLYFSEGDFNVTSLTFNHTKFNRSGGVSLFSLDTFCTAINFPNLTETGADFTGVSPYEWHLYGAFTIDGNAAVVSISLPQLVTCKTYSPWIVNNTSLTTITMPKFVPVYPPPIHGANASARQHLYYGNALSQATVDHILERYALSTGFASNGLLRLNGGTNSPPSAAGMLNKLAIEARGPTVLVNP